VNTLVVYCHPDPSSFTAAVKDTAVEALRAGGHEVRLRDLYAEGFDPCFSADEQARHRESGAADALAEHTAELRWCEHLVLVYPTWWSAQPAMLKGWIDRVWVRDVAWDLPEGGNRVRARLRNVKRITTVTSHGSSKWVNRLAGEAGKRTVSRSLRALCHPLAHTRWLALYGMDTAAAEDRERFLRKVARKLG
jgi:NAD(P)H dehydrogenase (quinone)